jgi:tetraacyldisaccharide 4'-kinase
VKSSIKRADNIIVTKCKTDLTGEEKENITREIDPKSHQQVYFTEIVYNQPYHLFTLQPGTIQPSTDVLLLSGIANPKPLKEFLTSQVHSYDMLRFADHHIFSSDDLQDIIRHFEKIQSADKMILTTEKDGVRLEKFSNELSHFPIFVLPIKHRCLFNDEARFEQDITKFVQSFRRDT